MVGANLATKDDIALLRKNLSLRILLTVGGATTVLLAVLGIMTAIIVSRL